MPRLSQPCPPAARPRRPWHPVTSGPVRARVLCLWCRRPACALDMQAGRLHHKPDFVHFARFFCPFTAAAMNACGARTCGDANTQGRNERGGDKKRLPGYQVGPACRAGLSGSRPAGGTYRPRICATRRRSLAALRGARVRSDWFRGMKERDAMDEHCLGPDVDRAQDRGRRPNRRQQLSERQPHLGRGRGHRPQQPPGRRRGRGRRDHRR